MSIVGVYKGLVEEEFISSNTFTFFQDIGERQTKKEEQTKKIIKSNEQPASPKRKPINNDTSHFIDTLAIIQDVTFKLEESEVPILHWWNRLGIWLSKLRRK
ncbi:hypothetical protein KPL26_04980 [Clostridium algidicarnis]|uniref:hypothetical protein n=1 Tax=Clostridium algidicarnis TaxID=37659 RepID=UPI001C0AE962|nr:hypothetical protein [Clostridium algidicarnis]MBU3196021.1 hypothetical protein [Clostridium algidicarnis]